MTEQTWVRAETRSGAVAVHAPSDVVADLDRMVRPFVQLVPAAPGPELPSVLVRRDPPEGLGWRRIALSSEYEPDRVLWVHDERRSVAVVDEPREWLTQQVLRSVRHMLRWQAYAAGDLLLHGGLVVWGGRGVVFVGGKRSGKTSSILSALLRGGVDFVSNDDVTIVAAAGGLVGYGFPRTVNVRTDSLLALARTHPALTGLLAGTSHPTNRFEGRHRTAEAIRTASGATLPGSVWVRLVELAEATGCRLRAEGPVAALVLPTFDDQVAGPVLTSLDRDTAAAALREHVERQGTRYDPFLAAWFPDTDESRRERIVDELLSTLPCYRLTQQMHRLGDATDLLRDELHHRGVPAGGRVHTTGGDLPRTGRPRRDMMEVRHGDTST